MLMTRHFDYCPSASEGDNQSVRSSAPVVSRCFPGGYNVKLYISRGRLAWWLLAFLHSDELVSATISLLRAGVDPNVKNERKESLLDALIQNVMGRIADTDFLILKSLVQSLSMTNAFLNCVMILVSLSRMKTQKEFNVPNMSKYKPTDNLDIHLTQLGELLLDLDLFNLNTSSAFNRFIQCRILKCGNHLPCAQSRHVWRLLDKAMCISQFDLSSLVSIRHLYDPHLYSTNNLCTLVSIHCYSNMKYSSTSLIVHGNGLSF